MLLDSNIARSLRYEAVKQAHNPLMLFDLITRARSQVALNNVRRAPVGGHPTAADAARLLRNYLLVDRTLKPQREKELKTYLSELQNQLRAAEARDMGLGPPALVQAQMSEAAKKLKRQEPATVNIPIVLASKKDAYKKYKRFALDADSDRLTALYRTEAKKLHLKIEFRLNADEKSATGTVVAIQSPTSTTLPDNIIAAISALTDPSALPKLDPNQLHIGQGAMGTCYLWAAVIAVAKRSPVIWKSLLDKVVLSPGTEHTVAHVQTSDNKSIPIRRSDYVRHFDERLICEQIADRSQPGQRISNLIPPPALLILELAEAEMRRGEDRTVAKGLGAVSGWSRDFLGRFLNGKKLWIDSCGGRSSNLNFHYSALPFSKPEIIKRLQDTLTKAGNDPSVALMAASVDKQHPNDRELQTSAGPIYKNHAYAVVGYDAVKKIISLINPWDSEKIIQLGFKEFCNSFAVLEGFQYQ